MLNLGGTRQNKITPICVRRFPHHAPCTQPPLFYVKLTLMVSNSNCYIYVSDDYYEQLFRMALPAAFVPQNKIQIWQ